MRYISGLLLFLCLSLYYVANLELWLSILELWRSKLSLWLRIFINFNFCFIPVTLFSPLL
ncbi:hypothetical protein HDV62DRAFT_347945 [Trichoderma sp. SZMC 28011]